MIPWLAGRPDFPPVEQALKDPDGLLAAGGELSPVWLLAAYRRGIFPWYTEDQPILWWSPDPRLVLIPAHLRISRSLRRTLRQQRFEIRFDTAFRDVIAACAEPREPGGGTWISAEIRQAYLRLHELGYAHSVESWVDGTLVGGLYGIALGRAFFGESMFSRRSDASKVALAHLAVHLQRLGYAAIDCQMTTAHLLSLGAEEMSRDRFCAGLASWTNEGPGPGHWSCERAAEISRNFS